MPNGAGRIRNIVISAKTLIQGIDKIGFYCSRVPDLETGRTWSKKVRCPFCEYESPTFTVNFEIGAWKCFHGDCGGGDVIDFMMRSENIDFKTAISRLDGRTKIDWSVIRRRERERQRKKLITLWLEWFLLLTEARMSFSAYMCFRYGDPEDWEDWNANKRKWADIIDIIRDDPIKTYLFREVADFKALSDEIDAEKIRLFEFYGGDRALKSPGFLEWAKMELKNE
jgi:hypothetical protein